MNIYKSDKSVVHALQVAAFRFLDGSMKRINKDKIQVQSSECVIVDTVDGKVKPKHGDWIIRLTNNELIVLPNSIFKALFHKF